MDIHPLWFDPSIRRQTSFSPTFLQQANAALHFIAPETLSRPPQDNDPTLLILESRIIHEGSAMMQYYLEGKVYPHEEFFLGSTIFMQYDLEHVAYCKRHRLPHPYPQRSVPPEHPREAHFSMLFYNTQGGESTERQFILEETASAPPQLTLHCKSPKTEIMTINLENSQDHIIEEGLNKLGKSLTDSLR